jgi:hypothetical protein
MKGSLLVVAAAGALVLAGLAFAANSSSFADPSGDSDKSPDVTNVAISNDDAGIVTVKVTLGNRATFSPDDEVGVGIDADQNPDTGSVYYGGEYELDLDGNVPSLWQASADGGYAQVSVPASMRATFSGGVVTISFKASDLGVTSGFNVYVIGLDRNWIDIAPDIRGVNYQLAAGTAPPALQPDRRAPIDRALKSSGVHGKTAELVYVAADGRGETAESIVVYKGKKVLKRINFRLADTNPFLPYFARWKVPKKVRGKLRFCVSSTDRAGNKSNTSCAALTIK